MRFTRILNAFGVGEMYFSYRTRCANRFFPLPKAQYALSFDLDHERDIRAVPRLLKILAKHRIPAAFACVGRWIECYPTVHRQIVHEGHEIINHTYSHPDSMEFNARHFQELSSAEQQEEIRRCDRVRRRIRRHTPIGFRTPHFGRAHTPVVYPLLRKLRYQYSSSTIAYHAPYYSAPYRMDGIVEIPLGCSPSNPRTPFDSWSSRVSPLPNFVTDEEFFHEFQRILDLIKRHRAFTTHYFDPAHMVRNGLIDRFCRALTQRAIPALRYRDLLQRVPIRNS